jgi:hypothetical protein
MASYTLKVDGLAVPDASVYGTLIGLKMPNTAGCRGRLRKLSIGQSGAPASVQIEAEVVRADNTSDGTATDSSAAVAKADPASPATGLSAVGSAFTGEPTVVAAGAVAGGAFNSYGMLPLDYMPEDAKIWGPNQTLLIRAQANAAVTVDVEVEWDEWF